MPLAEKKKQKKTPLQRCLPLEFQVLFIPLTKTLGSEKADIPEKMHFTSL